MRIVAVPFVAMVAGFAVFVLGMAAVVSSVLAATPQVTRSATQPVEAVAPVGLSSGPPAAAATADGGGLARPTAPVPKSETVLVAGFRVHGSLAADLQALLAAAEADGISFGGWGWRDHQTQIRLRREHCGTSDYAIWQMPSSRCSPPTARPGSSQHERGLAIDFTFQGRSINTRRSPGYRWLADNAERFGLFNLPSEPWHWSTTGR